MSEENTGDYYATDDEAPHVKTKEEGTKKISQVEITSGPEELKYSCSVDVEITNTTAEDLNDMIKVLQPEDMFIGIEGKETDLKTFLTENPATTNIKFKIKGNRTKDIELYIRLVNKNEPQDYLAGKELGLDIKTQNLKCEIDTSKGMTGLELAQSESKGLIQITDETDLKYRYVGACDATSNDCDGVVDNFICFGITDANSCKILNSNYLYRIIGITEQGNLKIIKNSSIGKYRWHSDYYGSDNNAVWDTGSSKIPAELYTNLNGSTFLTNFSPQYVPSGWTDKIETTSWKIGDSSEGTSNNGYGAGKTDTGSQVWSWESASNASASSKIGLMNLSDYYYSLDGTGSLNCYNGSSDEDSKCKTSWLHISNNGDNSTTYTSEWTMTRYGQYSENYYHAWYVYSGGAVSSDGLNSTNAVRPVFYLTDDTVITSGTGTLSDPYIIGVD